MSNTTQAGSIEYKVKIDLGEFKQKTKELERSASSAAKNSGKSIDSLDSKTQKATESMSNSLEKLKKALIVVGATAATGFGLAVKQFADNEQLVGGVDKIFGRSSEIVKRYADEAYKSAGLSANRYMETVTSFSASLLNSLGGDSKKAAELANQAVIDMSDNANTYGTDIARIQDAYQGFAKQNYTMLDNLKLGYGGTATEMARLINNSGVMGSSFKATAKNINEIPFSKMIEAIHKIQVEQHIAGTTAKEASNTISGAWNQLRGSFENVLAGISGSDKSLADSIAVMANQVITKFPPIAVNLARGLYRATVTAIDNQFGQGNIFSGAIKAFKSLVDFTVKYKDVLAPLAVSIGTMIGLYKAWKIATVTATAVQAVFNAVLAANPIGIVILAISGLVAGLVWFFTQTKTGQQILKAFGDAVVAVWNWISQGFKFMTDVIKAIWEGIKAYFSAVIGFYSGIFGAAFNAVVSIWNGITGFFKGIWNGIVGIFSAVVGFYSNVFGTAINVVRGIWSAITGFFSRIVGGIHGAISRIPGIFGNIFRSAWNKITSIFGRIGSWFSGLGGQLVGAGRNVISGLVRGIAGGRDAVVNKIKNICSGALDAVKHFFGIKSPSRVMAQMGDFLMQGFSGGIESKMGMVATSMNKASRVAMNAFSPTLDANMNIGASSNLSLARGLANADPIARLGGAGKPAIVQTFNQKIGDGITLDQVNRSAIREARRYS